MKNTFFFDPGYEYLAYGEGRLKFDTLGPPLSSLIFFGFIVLVFGLISYLITSWAFNTLQLSSAFFSEGVETVVSVVDCQQTTSGSNYVLLTVRYTIQDAPYETQAGIYTVPHRCEDFPSEMQLEALYLPSNPSQIRFLNQGSPIIEALLVGIMPLCVSGFFTIASLVLIFSLIWSIISYFIAIPRYHRLRNKGVVLNGTIVETRLKENRSSRSLSVDLEIVYEFSTSNGRIVRDKQRKSHTSRRESDAPIPGTQIRVLYADDKTYVAL